MRRQVASWGAGTLLVAAFAVSLAAEKRMTLESQWPEKAVVVDGDDGEWPGPLMQISEKPPIVASVQNDNNFLYLVLAASDQATRMQILRQGLVVWFDPAGGTKKEFGIKYPIGGGYPMRGGRGGSGGHGDPGGYNGGSGSGDPGDPQSSDRPRPPRPEAPPNRLEVMGAKKDDVRSFTADQVPGIAVKLGEVEGSAVYELKVPLAGSVEFPYAIGAKAGTAIGLTIETPKLEMPSEGRGGYGGGGGGFGGGMGGRGGGGGGRGGGMGGPGGGGHGEMERPKDIKISVAVQTTSR
jgi:hypothetical protein